MINRQEDTSLYPLHIFNQSETGIQQDKSTCTSDTKKPASCDKRVPGLLLSECLCLIAKKKILGKLSFSLFSENEKLKGSMPYTICSLVSYFYFLVFFFMPGATGKLLNNIALFKTE